MSRRARTRANARPWESMSFGPEDDLEEGDEGEEEPIGDWSSDVQASAANQTEKTC